MYCAKKIAQKVLSMQFDKQMQFNKRKLQIRLLQDIFTLKQSGIFF